MILDEKKTMRNGTVDDEPEEDFSDVLEIPANLAEESNAFRALDARRRSVRVWLIANACATAALFIESVVGSLLFSGEAESYALVVWISFLAAKLFGSAFLGAYWRSLDASVSTISPRRVALLNLVPGYELYWFFVAFRGGANAGIATIDRLDGNRRQHRAPTGLAQVAWGTRVAALLAFAVIAVFAFIELLDAHDVGESVWLALTGATLGFGFISLTLFGSGLLLFFIGYGSASFLIAAQTTALVAVGARMALIWRMARIAEYANDVRMFSERNATPEERADARERLDLLFNDSKNTDADGGAQTDGRDGSDVIDRT